MLNHVCLAGRLTKDPVLRKTETQKSVVSFSIACERDFSNGGQKESDFYDVIAWGNTAEFVSKYFSKGKMIIVDGRLQTGSYTAKDGTNRKTVEIVASSVYFCGAKRDEARNDSNGSTVADVGVHEAINTPVNVDSGDAEDEDTGLPF